MDIVYVLLPIAILIAILALIAFIWAVRTGQFEDLKTPALRILFDDRPVKGSKIDK